MEAPISATHGVMRSLPWMLEFLLSDHGHGLQKGEKKKIHTLKGDLEELMKYLVEPSEVEAPALTASSWMKEVRELSYDIHDFVDELIINVDEIQQEEEAPHSHMISRFQEMFKRHQKVDDEISRFRARVKEAIQLHKDHLIGNLKMWPPSNNKAAASSDWPPAAAGHAQLVGLASSVVDELSGMLANDGKPQHKVASIVGVGGVGKTTLANHLYSKLAGQFQCRAFVRTSRKPDPRRLLSSILSQVQRHQPLRHGLGIPNLVNEIKEYLRDKTYFIIIDDLWAPSTWDIVYRALPRGGYCSRILTTTEVEVVARVCCAGNSNYIFRKQLLSDNESRELYSNIVSVHRSDQSPKNFNEVPDEIIKEMGGLPLAIVIMANILARQPARLDQYMKNYPSSVLMKVSDLDGMKQVLNLSYNSLPHCLKACMLYLSLYEEYSVIWKNDLVKLWISEGFICAMEGEDKEEVAHRYFDELVDRGMIQPVDTSSNDEVMSCTVHYMVLDMIRYKSIEENFIIAIDHSQTSARLGDKIRRLALHFGDAEDAKPPTSMRLSQVRSLAFSGLFKCMPSIVEFQVLRVLILKLSVDPDDTSYCDLTGISGLFRLRYLHIDACHVTVELPTQMKGLRDLAALEIQAKVTAVPSDIIDMPSLLYLSLPSEAHLPTGIGRMAVRTLGFNLSSNSEYSVMDLGNLTNLQDLHLTCCTLDSDNLKNKMQILGSVLSTHTKLKSVTLVHSRSYHVNALNDVGVSSTTVSPSPDLFQRLQMSRRCYIFYGLPQWIGKLSKLCILKIAVLGLSTNDFDVLKGLPSLIALSLYIHTLPEERIVFTKEGFSHLKYLKLRGNALRVKIEEDAMPNLQKLKLCFNAPRLEEGRTAPISIEHLSSLKEISAKIGGTGGGAHTESTMMTAISSHSSNPRINVQTVDYFLYLDANVKIEENEHRTQGQPILDDEKTQGISRISFHPESSTNLPVPAIAELTGMNSSRAEDATVTCSTGAKSSTLTVKLKVDDLECSSCYNKIRKVLCKLQDKANMKTIYFDLRNKKVIISGPFDPHKLSDRLERKLGRVIEEIEVERQPTTAPPQTNKKPDQLQLVEDNLETSKQNIQNQTTDEDDIEIVDTKAGKQQHTMQPDVPNYDIETTVTLGTRQGQSKQRFTEVCTVCHLWPCSDPMSHPSFRNKKINRGQQCSQHQRGGLGVYYKSIRRLQHMASRRARLRSLFSPISHASASATGLHALDLLRPCRLRLRHRPPLPQLTTTTQAQHIYER